MGDIANLIGLLDNDSSEVAENAKAELISIGAEVGPALVAAVGSLGVFGQLSAIEVFEHFADDSAGPALIGLLDSHNSTVREWSAWALADLGVRKAVPSLRLAYQRYRATAGELDHTEPVALRHALTRLGGRTEVVPPLALSLRVATGGLREAWPSGQLTDVINDLADHQQLVLYFMLWAVADRGTFWKDHDRLGQSLDLSKHWPDLVESARESALIEAVTIDPHDDLFATIEWINHTDR